MGTEQWEVASGVPPVINAPKPLEPDEDVAEDTEAERLEEWFTHIAMPWASDTKSPDTE
jgi:hypothetical protein